MKVILFVFSCLIINWFARSQTPKCIQEKYELVWQDEFEGESLDTSKWSYRATGNVRGNGIVREKNCYLDGKGHLIIEVTKEDSNYYIGQIATMKKHLWKFGYFECRAKLSDQLGPSSSFWLQSPKFNLNNLDAKQYGAEIDIMEYRRKVATNEIHHTVHWGGYGDLHKQKGKTKKVKGIDTGYHTFGLKWTKHKYVFYIDGKRTWCTLKATSHVKQYIILSLELVDWGGDPSNSTFPDQMVCDYVRVYKKVER